MYRGVGVLGLKGFEPNYYSTLIPLRGPKIYRWQWLIVWGGSWGVSEEICFVCKFSEILSLLTLPISALCYCTVFSVLLWMWQCVCLVCYCECGSASVPVTVHCLVCYCECGSASVPVTVQCLVCYCECGSASVPVTVHCLVCYCECGSPSVPVTAVSWMLSVSAQALHAALYRSIYSLLTWSYLGTMQGFLASSQNSGERLLASCLNVRPFDWNNSVPTVRIFFKFDIWEFSKIFSEN